MESIHLSQNNDKWTYAWGSPLFVSSKAYSHLLGSVTVSPVYKWLWNSSCMPKRKVSFWLAMKDRLSTKELLKRRNMALPSYNCVLCHLDTEESLHHLFLDCPFAMACWNMIGLPHLLQDNLLDTITIFRVHFARPFFMEVFVAMFWGIWTARNDVIFRNQAHSLQNVRKIFRQELAWVRLRARKDFSVQLGLWLDNFV